ncbi:hypothetical protein VULLAG_LOCUS17414 [Vulpes lagopus]
MAHVQKWFLCNHALPTLGSTAALSGILSKRKPNTLKKGRGYGRYRSRKHLAMVTLGTVHSITAAYHGLQKSRLSQKYQMLEVPLAVKEASQITATPQLLSENDLPQD